ncbi:hypothetical protein BSM4216_3034 [Bacillus smithii]|nr:hypothetical protein BSM4216_3034 [Bacillus smithii]
MPLSIGIYLIKLLSRNSKMKIPFIAFLIFPPISCLHKQQKLFLFSPPSFHQTFVKKKLRKILYDQHGFK